jgi:hypothetical protein
MCTDEVGIKVGVKVLLGGVLFFSISDSSAEYSKISVPGSSEYFSCGKATQKAL